MAAYAHTLARLLRPEATEPVGLLSSGPSLQLGPVTHAIAATQDEHEPQRRGLILGLATLPMLGLGAVAAPAPSSLSRACDWAVQHTAWIERTAYPEKWSDERLDDEMDGVTAVYQRAIDEPSAGLADTQAKSRLLLDEYEQLARTGHRDRDLLLALTILREVIAL